MAESSGGHATLPLTLHIINGDWLNAKIESADGRLQKWLGQSRSDDELVTAFYELALCRSPRAKELQHWKTKLALQIDVERNAVFATPST